MISKYYDENARIHKRSLIYIMKKACDGLGEDFGIRVLFSIGDGYYCRPVKVTATEDFIRKLWAEMERLIKLNHDLTDETWPEDLLTHAGEASEFDLSLYGDGFILWVQQEGISSHHVDEKLFNVYEHTSDWAGLVGLPSISDLNRVISSGNIRDVILMQEAAAEANVARIASRIREKGAGLVLIAGPSSSGKTTFSHRLSIQLMARGLNPHPLAMDDFFKNREDAHIDEDGKKDYEDLRSLDVDRFNHDMESLLSGRETELPIYDFVVGSRSNKTRTMKLKKGDVLVVEGIHGLNETLSRDIPADEKFKIYISSLNTISMDDYYPLATSDGRLLRRIVRDARVRNTSAEDTILRWPSVRRGEHKNIFPFQEEAEVIFNSAHVYELSVMKLFAQPRLQAISKDSEVYGEVKRLTKLLDQVLPMPTEDIPNNSLIREFIGGGCFGV